MVQSETQHTQRGVITYCILSIDTYIEYTEIDYPQGSIRQNILTIPQTCTTRFSMSVAAFTNEFVYKSILGIVALMAVGDTYAFTTPAFTRGVFVSQSNGAYRTLVGTHVKLPNAFTRLDAKKKGGKQIVSDIDFDALDDDEPLSKKDQMKAQKDAEKAAKKKAKEVSEDMTNGSSNGKVKTEPKAAAAVEALKNMNFDDFDNEPMSAKEKAELEKKKAKEAKKKATEVLQTDPNSAVEDVPGPVKKDKKAAALKALEEMERMEAQLAAEAQNVQVDEYGMPQGKMSKKELKEARKKAEKEAEKKAAKEAKKASKRLALDDVDIDKEDAEDSPIDLSAVGSDEIVRANGSTNDMDEEVSHSYAKV